MTEPMNRLPSEEPADLVDFSIEPPDAPDSGRVQAAGTLPAMPLQELAHQIQETHHEAKAHAECAVLCALRVGALCLQAKEQLPHGKFQEWIGENTPNVTYRTAAKYMLLVENSKSESDSLLPLLLAPDLSEKLNDYNERQYLLDATEAFRQGRGLTDLYKDYGVIKQTNVDRFGTNNPAGNNGSEKPPSERWEIRREIARGDRRKVMHALKPFMDRKRYQFLDDVDAKLLAENLVASANEIRDWLKREPLKRNPGPWK